MLDSWNLLVNSDPTISGPVVVTNTSGVTTTFMFTFLLPVATFPQPNSAIRGSIQGGATDLGTDGLGVIMSSTALGNAAIYASKINGATVQTMYEDPNSVSAGVFGSANLPAQTYGIPIPITVLNQLTGSIQLDIQFTLSPGDQASVTSVFNAEPIPEPGSLGLLGAGLGALVLLRRRSH